MSDRDEIVIVKSFWISSIDLKLVCLAFIKILVPTSSFLLRDRDSGEADMLGSGIEIYRFQWSLSKKSILVYLLSL